MTECIGIIPARGGSKGIPNKNLVDVGGKPLIEWTIRAALESQIVTEVVVSSDSAPIRAVAEGCGVRAIARPMNLSSDDALTAPVVAHTLQALEVSSGIGVLLQPTSPLRDAEAVDCAVRLFCEKGASSVISVRRAEQNPTKAFLSEQGRLRPWLNKEAPFLPRQASPDFYYANGAIYVFDIRLFLEGLSFFIEPCFPFEMSLARSVDVDTVEDLNMVRRMMVKHESD